MAETPAPPSLLSSPAQGGGIGAAASAGLSTMAGVVLAGVMMVSVVDVFGRYVLNRPLPGSSEITEILMALLIYAGLPVVSQRNAHISVDMFSGAIPKAIVPIRNFIIGVLCAAVLAVIAWRLWVYADQIRDSKDVTEYLKLPQAPVAYVMSVFAGITALIELYRAVFPVPPTDVTIVDPV